MALYGLLNLIYLFVAGVINVIRGREKLGDLCSGSSFIDDYRRRNGIYTVNSNTPMCNNKIEQSIPKKPDLNEEISSYITSSEAYQNTQAKNTILL